MPEKMNGLKLPGRLIRSLYAIWMAAALAVYACALPVYRWISSAPDEAKREDGVSLTAIAASDPALSETIELYIALAHAEERIEEELAKRGFSGVDAIVGSGSVCIILDENPDEQQAAAIFETAQRMTGCAPADIRLIPAGRP